MIRYISLLLLVSFTLLVSIAQAQSVNKVRCDCLQGRPAEREVLEDGCPVIRECLGGCNPVKRVVGTRSGRSIKLVLSGSWGDWEYDDAVCEIIHASTLLEDLATLNAEY